MAMTSQSQRAGYPLTWKVPAGVVEREAWVKISQVRTLSTERLGRRIGQMNEPDLSKIVEGLLELIG